MQKTVRKTIAFPVGLVQDLEIIAFQYHMDFPDFMRYLGIKKLEEARAREQEKVYYMSPETEKAVTEGRKEIGNGKAKTFKNAKSLMDYVLDRK